MIRLFVALDLPEAIRDALLAVQGGVPGARWSRAEQMHLTLRFIGEVAENVARDIDDALAKGDPVLVKVILHSGAQHWVLLVGRDQTDYLIKNPLGDGKTLDKLSSLGSDILAVRLIKRL